jgi:hypothetical protein
MLEMQPTRRPAELSKGELEIELELAWALITASAGRWRELQAEARQRHRRDASDVFEEMLGRRLPPMRRRK